MDIHSLLARLPVKRFREPAPVVAVLRLAGVIGAVGPLRSGLTLAGLADQIERAFKLPRLKAVALAVNSPGGSPVQSDLIARRIRALAAEKEVPVLAFGEDVAASGGYWLACAADEIFVHESSIIGSIGVVAAGFGFHEVLARHGIERRVYTAGDKKLLLDPFRPEDPEDVARLRRNLDDIHADFKAMVKARRGPRLRGDDEALFSGEFWTGRRAVELGLADGVGDLRSVLRQRFGDKVVLRRVESAKPWWRRRLGAGALAAEPQDWVAGLLSAAEERALWARYGL